MEKLTIKELVTLQGNQDYFWNLQMKWEAQGWVLTRENTLRLLGQCLINADKKTYSCHIGSPAKPSAEMLNSLFGSDGKV